MTLPRWTLPMIGALLGMPVAAAQTTLGELLDAGATRLSREQFRDELEQRMVMGPLPTGGNLEIMYAKNGRVVGTGKSPMFYGPHAPVGGDWRIDQAGVVCSTMRIQSYEMPPRCQYWFKLKDRYFVADSDTDRSAKVLVRTIKK